MHRHSGPCLAVPRGGVSGADGSGAFVSDSSGWTDKALNLVSMTDRDRARGSSGMGLSGWEVEDTGMLWQSLLELVKEGVEDMVLADGGDGGRTA